RVLGSVHDTTAVHAMETEDFAAAVMRTPASVPAVLMATTAAYPGFAETIELIGTQGTARLQQSTLDVRFHDGSKLHIDDNWQSTDPDNPMDFPYAAHLGLITDFLAALDARREPAVTAADALYTQRLIDE